MRSILLILTSILIFFSCDNDTSERCGNGTIDPDEQCDGDKLSVTDCASLEGSSFTGGALFCKSDCTFDTSNCILPVCGNGTIENGEECDDSEHGGKTCEDYGYSSGFLVCKPDCSGFYTGSCHNNGGTCGDGILDSMEFCDGSETWHSCAQAGFSGGTEPLCNTNCTYDYSSCEGDLCEMAGFYDDGYCMGCEVMNGHEDPDCNEKCHLEDGTCSSLFVKEYGTSSCIYTTGNEDPDCGTCGDGIWNRFGASGTMLEECDGNDLGDVKCEDHDFTGGTLRCSPNCRYDFSDCF